MTEDGRAMFGSTEGQMAGLCEHYWPVCYTVCFCKINTSFQYSISMSLVIYYLLYTIYR
jgi:hypothetical protein